MDLLPSASNGGLDDMYAVVKNERAPGAELSNVPTPKARGSEVLVKVTAASI